MPRRYLENDSVHPGLLEAAVALSWLAGRCCSSGGIARRAGGNGSSGDGRDAASISRGSAAGLTTAVSDRRRTRPQVVHVFAKTGLVTTGCSFYKRLQPTTKPTAFKVVHYGNNAASRMMNRPQQLRRRLAAHDVRALRVCVRRHLFELSCHNMRRAA